MICDNVNYWGQRKKMWCWVNLWNEINNSSNNNIELMGTNKWVLFFTKNKLIEGKALSGQMGCTWKEPNLNN